MQPVLTAIGLVNGKPWWEPVIFDPQESTCLNRSLKNFLSQVIKSTTSTAVQNLVEIRPCGVKY